MKQLVTMYYKKVQNHDAVWSNICLLYIFTYDSVYYYLGRKSLLEFVLDITHSFLGITLQFCVLSLCLSSQLICLALSPTS